MCFTSKYNGVFIELLVEGLSLSMVGVMESLYILWIPPKECICLVTMVSKMNKFQKQFRSLSDETVTKASLGSQSLTSDTPLSSLFMAVDKKLD